MKLEQQVPSLELCKKLKELGYPQESLFYWTFYKDHSQVLYTQQEVFKESWKVDPNYCSAPTVAELGELLKPFSSATSTWYNREDNVWSVVVEEKLIGSEESFNSDTEADTRAKALIYLLKKQTIKL